jgi:hypothetical protein
VGPGADASNFYYISFKAGTGFTLNKLTRDSNGDFLKNTLITNLTGTNGLDLGNTSCASLVYTDNKVFATGYVSSTRNALYELLNPTFHPLPDFDKLTSLLSHEDAVVIVGTNSLETSHGIARFDSSTDTLTTLLPLGTYKIGSTTISQGGEIIFTGTLVSSGGGVIGTISPTNLLTVRNLSVEPNSIASVK